MGLLQSSFNFQLEFSDVKTSLSLTNLLMLIHLPAFLRDRKQFLFSFVCMRC